MTYTYLAHHGIKGQKWGVRRFQDADGSLTAAGRARYSDRMITSEKGLMLSKRLAENDYRENLKTISPADKAGKKEAKRQFKENIKSIKADYKHDKKVADAEWKEQRQSVIALQSKGKQMVTGILLGGPHGLRSYNSLRALGYTDKEAFRTTFAMGVLPIIGKISMARAATETAKDRYNFRIVDKNGNVVDHNGNVEEVVKRY